MPGQEIAQLAEAPDALTIILEVEFGLPFGFSGGLILKHTPD